MWFIFALAISIINSCYAICNQNSKLKPQLFIIYRGFLTGIAVLPTFIFFHADFEWPFYVIVLLQGLAISYMDFKYFRAFHLFGAEMICSVRPLTVIITFCLWIIITPSLLVQYINTPDRTLVIIASIATIVYSVIKYREQPIGLNCLAHVFPLLFISSFVDISNKVILYFVNGHILEAALYRIFFIGMIIGGINLALTQKRQIKIKEIYKFSNIKKGLFILLLPLSMILVNFSLYYAENPAYTSAIIYLSVVWILLINKIKFKLGFSTKKYKRIALKWIFLLLAAAITLLLATK